MAKRLQKSATEKQTDHRSQDQETERDSDDDTKTVTFFPK